MTQRSRSQELVVGGLLVAGIGIAAFMSIKVGAFRMDTGTMDLSAPFDNVAGLTEGAMVSVSGVDVGYIKRLAVEDGRAWTYFAVDKNIAVHEDAILRIRARSVLGEKYLQLEPGSPDAPLLQEGGKILTTAGQVEIDEMVTAMGPLLGAADPEAVSQVLRSLSDAFSKDPEQLRRMLDDTEALVHNLRVASEDAPALVADARQAVNDVRRTVREVEPLMARANNLVADLEQATGPLAEASQEAPRLMADLEATLADARHLLQNVDASSADLAEVLSNLKEIDKWELRRLLREEGVLMRIRSEEVVPDERADPEGAATADQR